MPFSNFFIRNSFKQVNEFEAKMKFPNARKFFGGMRKRIYGIFGRKFGATPSKSKQPQPIGHNCRLPMELECESTSAITIDLPPRSHRKLPAELNREIYLFFNPATQRKFICGLGWDFYAMFRHRLLTKTNRVCNPGRNYWSRTTPGAIISNNGLHARNKITCRRRNIYAKKGFAISGKHLRADNFTGRIIYYYEVKLLSKTWCMVGLSNGIPNDEWIGAYPNSYAITTVPILLNWCDLAGETHFFELPDGAIRPKLWDNGTNMNVYGCGLVMDPNDKLAIFFTLNGILMGRPIPISPSVDDYLVPAIRLSYSPSWIKANFGNAKNKPFKYDIKKCPGMGLD